GIPEHGEAQRLERLVVLAARLERGRRRTGRRLEQPVVDVRYARPAVAVERQAEDDLVARRPAGRPRGDDGLVGEVRVERFTGRYPDRRLVVRLRLPRTVEVVPLHGSEVQQGEDLAGLEPGVDLRRCRGQERGQRVVLVRAAA